MSFVDDDQDTPSDRLRQAFEMFEFGVEMMAASLRRQHPAASPEALEAWLAERPGAPDGDADGIPVHLPIRG